MKAMILAAGRGERMRPLTDSRPKPLLKVNGKALIEWHIQALVEAGITDIVINTCWLGDLIPEYLGDGAYWGANLHFVHEESALETAGGIANTLEFFAGEPFLVVNGDVWCDISFEHLPQLSGMAHLWLVENPEHNPNGDFSLTEQAPLDSQSSVSDKSETSSNYTFSGIGLYHPDLFAGVTAGEPAALAPLLRNAMAQSKVTGELYDGQWHDIGTPERLKSLNDSFSRSHSVIEFE